MKYNIGDLLEYKYTHRSKLGTSYLLTKNVINIGYNPCYEFMNLTEGYDANVAVSTVDAPWVNETYYFLIKGEPRFDIEMEFEYPYLCLNDGKTGWGNFGNPSTRKVA